MYLPSDAQLVTDSYSLVVDAIFGVGFEPPMSSDFAAIVQTISRSKVPVVSIDVPSGKRLKQASHWHEFYSRNASQYGVSSRAITKSVKNGKVTRGLPMSCNLSRVGYELFTKCVRDTQCHT